jgi:transposase
MSEATSKQAGDAYAQKTSDELVRLLRDKDAQITRLLHDIEVLRKMHFGPRSEKSKQPLNPKTLLPFPGITELLERVQQATKERAAVAAAAANASSQPPAEAAPNGAAKSASAKKPSGPRSEFPDHLPRKVTRVEIPEDQRRAPCGKVKKEIGVQITQEIEHVRITYVHRIETVKYACADHPEEGVQTAPGRTPVIEGGLLGPGFLAQLIVDHFGDHMPYARLERKFSHEGIDLARSVLCRSVLRCGELLAPVFTALKKEMLGSFLVQADETPVIIRNGNKAGRKRGFMWIYRSAEGNCIFELCPGRGSEWPVGMLGDYRGFVQSDAYAGYDVLFRHGEDRVPLGCWAHMRRKFENAATTAPPLFAEIDAVLKLVFKFEADAKGQTSEARQKWRDDLVRPLLVQMKDWLDAKSMEVLPQSPMGEAIKHARKHWVQFTNFLRDGRITDITNNAAERALRQVAVGRKNWMFIGHQDAGPAAAALMSLMQTCREHRVNPIDYFRDVLVRISEPGSAARVRDLLPANWKAAADAAQRQADARQAIANAVRGLVYS